MKTFPLIQKLIISSTLLVGVLASAQSDISAYKVNEIIPVQSGTEVVWRNWKGEYVNVLVDSNFMTQNRARTTYLRACADEANLGQLCESFYSDWTLMRYVFVSSPGTCAERGEGQPAVCVGDIVKSQNGPLPVRVVGIGSGVHFNLKTNSYSRKLMTQDLEAPEMTQVYSQKINEVWLLNR